MVKCGLTFGLLISTFLCARIAMGEAPPTDWSFTPSVGFSLFEGGSHKDRPVFSLGAGRKLNERWEAEGSLINITTETKGTRESELEIYQAVMGLRYDLDPSEKLIPFLLAGGGGFYADSDLFGTTSGISLHVGAGFRYRLDQNFALKGEIRQQTFFGMLDDEGERKNCSDLITLVGLEIRFPEARQSAVASVPVAEVPATVVAAPATDIAVKAAPEPLPPVVVVNPRFSPGKEEILDWPSAELEKIGVLIRQQAIVNIVVMSDVDERSLSYDKFRLQDRRALRLRYFLIDHFGLDPQTVKITSHVNLARFSEEESNRQLLIRFVPVENVPVLSKISMNSGEGK